MHLHDEDTTRPQSDQPPSIRTQIGLGAGKRSPLRERPRAIQKEFGRGIGQRTPDRTTDKQAAIHRYKHKTTPKTTTNNKPKKFEEPHPEDWIYDLLTKILSNSSKFGDEGIEYAKSLDAAIDPLIDQVEGNVLHQNVLVSYLTSISQFFNKMSTANIQSMLDQCKGLGNTIANSRQIQLLNVKLMFIYFSKIPPQGSPIIALTQHALDIVDHMNELDNETQKSLYLNLINVVENWLAIGIAPLAEQNEMYVEFFDRLTIFYNNNPNIWQALIEAYVECCQDRREKEQMQHVLVDAQLAQHNGSAVEEVRERLNESWFDLSKSPQKKDQIARHRLLEDALVVLNRLENPEDEAIAGQFQEVVKRHTESNSPALRALGISLMVLGGALILTGAILFAIPWMPSTATTLIPSLIINNFMAGAGTAVGAGMISALTGVGVFRKGQPDSDGVAYARLNEGLAR